MRTLTLPLGVLLSLWPCFVAVASAQSEPLREASGERSFYVVDKSPAPVFSSSHAPRPESGREAALGDFFFAVEETETRVLVAQYPPVQELGWMNKSDLLEQRTHALTISEGVRQGLAGEIAPVDLDGALNANNVLFLRVVTQPERRVRLRGRPGAGAGSDERLETWRWFYAYDLETFDEQTWVLLGDRRRMLTGESVFEDTRRVEPRRALRGWVPLEHVTVWSTNVALELDTDPLAVARRLHDASPAVIFASDHLQSELLWVEPITSFWSAASPHPKVRTDPGGLDPFFPRLPVLQTVRGQFEVAFAASPGDYQLYHFGEISQRVKAAELSLRQVDVVFVIDATGSMNDAIDATLHLVRSVGRALEGYLAEGQVTTIDLPNGGTLEISEAMDVSVSVIGFQDTKEAAARGGTYNVRQAVVGANLVEDAADIENALASLKLDTARSVGPEALHDALREAMKPDYWRSDSMTRLVILMTDEGGDTDDLPQLMDEMPVYTEELLQMSTQLREEVGSDLVINKKRRTRLYSVFLGPRGEWTAFRRNVEAASAEIFRLTNFAGGTRGDVVVAAVSETLEKAQQSVSETVRAFYRGITDRQPGSALMFDAPDGASDLAIAIALKRQGLTVDEVDRLNATIYIGGYVREPNVVLPQGGQSAATPHWRLRVLVSRRDALDMKMALYGAFRGLERALDRSPVLQGLGGRRDPAVSRRELVAAVIVRALDEITGGLEYGFAYDNDGDRHALRAARSLLDEIDSGGGLAGENLARFVSVSRSLPIRSDGLLGLPLAELADKDMGWFAIQKDTIEAQSAGWENILLGWSVPENPAEIFAHAGVAKLWFMQIDSVRGNDVAHVPFNYIP